MVFWIVRDSLIVNSDDFKVFLLKNKYLSAKLVTYFAEHPLLFCQFRMAKGILVSTADYGPDTYEFAKAKPLTLLNGSNLLHLL